METLNYITYGGLITAFLLAVLILLFAIASIWSWLSHLYELRIYESTRNSFMVDVSMLATWCSYEFPVITDLEHELISSWQNGVRPNPDRFRDGIRKKYLATKETK